jgi:hypothetical protein
MRTLAALVLTMGVLVGLGAPEAHAAGAVCTSSGGGGAMSADGRFVAFSSCGAGPFTDVFVRDTSAGTTERVSVAADGGQADESSSAPSRPLRRIPLVGGEPRSR